MGRKKKEEKSKEEGEEGKEEEVVRGKERARVVAISHSVDAAAVLFGTCPHPPITHYVRHIAFFIVGHG